MPGPSQKALQEWFDYNKDGTLVWKQRGVGRSFGNVAGSGSGDRYWIITFQKKPYRRSQLIWIFHHGDRTDNDLQIDHINRNTWDDRIENLRLVTRRYNCNNRRRKSQYGPSIYKRPSGRFAVCPHIGGKRITIGTYDDLEEAKAAYQRAIREEVC
jgi:hypothetical protein